MTFITSKISGEVRIPSSKSQAHRALICAALAGNSTVCGIDSSNDIKATLGALRALGAEIAEDTRTRSFYIKKPCSHSANAGVINSGESASTLRFFIPLAAALGDSVTFVGEGRLPKRPTDIYKPLLEAHGARLDYPENGDFLPLSVTGKLECGEYRLRGDISSQFVTGLLLALGQLRGESKIVLTTTLESKPYADLTVDVMRRFGSNITELEDGYTIVGSGLIPHDMTVEGDCSQAAFFAVAAAIGGSVTMTGLRRDTKQGDLALFDVVERFGASVKWAGDTVTVSRAGELTASDIDASDIPDLVPALAVMAALSRGTTRIWGAGRLRIKESDRIASTAALLTALGAEVSETEDGLLIVGREQLTGGFVRSFNDHRIAMAAAAASVGCISPVTVDDMSCINKSYPDFVKDFESVVKG